MKSTKAVVPLTDTKALTNVPPPATYCPVSPTCPVIPTAYEVVSAPIDADESYNANLKVLPVEGVKSCTPSRISSLKVLHIAFVVIAILFSPY